MVNVLMLRNLRGLKAAVEIAREHKANITGIDFEWERDGLLGEYDVEVGFDDDAPEIESNWVMRANQWCRIPERNYFDMLLRNRDTDLNFLVGEILRTGDSRRLVAGGSGEETRLRKLFFDVGREHHALKRFIRPQFDQRNMVAVLKNRHRLFDLFGEFLKGRSPELHVFVRWGNVLWVDGKVLMAGQVEVPIMGANEELGELWKTLFRANFIPDRRNKRQAKGLMPKYQTDMSGQGKWERQLVENGIERPLTDFY